MTKTIKSIFIFGLLSFIIACNGQGVTTTGVVTTTIETTENSTINITETTDNLTTTIPETTNTQTTTEAPTSTDDNTEAPTSQPTTTEPPTTTDNITEATTLEPTTTETTTSFPTTTEVPTTEQPTTLPTATMPTTVAPTTEWVTIYFENVSGATSINTLSGMPGNAFTMPDDPIRSGYEFGGWFEDQSLTIPFNITVYPNNDMTVYAKWTIIQTSADILAQVLIDDYGFTCINNVCEYEQGSWMTYTFNLNTVTFTKEIDDNDASGDYQTKNEIVVINENWYVEYNISITYLSTQNASMRVTGNANTGSYTVRSWSSNYLSEDGLYDDAVDFIDGPYGSGLVGFIESALSSAGLTMDDLK